MGKSFPRDLSTGPLSEIPQSRVSSQGGSGGAPGRLLGHSPVTGRRKYALLPTGKIIPILSLIRRLWL